jgi:hypothetical protein
LAFAIGFVVSLLLMLRVALWLTDPLTYRPYRDDDPHRDFPALVVTGDEASVMIVDNPHQVSPPASGASFLVPAGKARAIERHIREHDTPDIDAAWVLKVSELSKDRQRIELFRAGDGYWGGVYDATPTTITPLFKKVAGPSFALVFGPLALGLNVALWGGGFLISRKVRCRRRGESRGPK